MSGLLNKGKQHILKGLDSAPKISGMASNNEVNI